MIESAELATHGIKRYLERYQNRELLRLLTCGSVDDGKSTLIGRLLHDSQAIFDDHMASLERDSVKHGTTGEEVDLALLMDGLKAEREQGITIDVAYRYFSTPRRKFVIADTPGHEQYTRNMATGASTCDLAVILIDARHGVLPQTRRHAFIASLLGIRHLVVAVNKMDLVDWSEEVYERIRAEFSGFAARLQVGDIHFIPISALVGDNVVETGEHMPWYKGGPLLDYLETVHIAADRNLIDLRFPVQYVLRPNLDFRGYAGTIASGIMRPGDEVLVLPSGRRTRIDKVLTWDGEIDEAFSPMAVTVTLADEVDVSRGDMLVHVNNVPTIDQRFEAMLVWMHQEPLTVGRQMLLKQTTVQTPATVEAVRYRIDVNSLRRERADGLGLNEIGRVHVSTVRPLAFDAYTVNQGTGAFILIDRIHNGTMAAGMIVRRDPSEKAEGRARAVDALQQPPAERGRVSTAERSERLGQLPFTVWLTGLPRAGKSSIAYALEKRLFDSGCLVRVLDGEQLRVGVNQDLGFSDRDRRENIRRAAGVARLFNETGVIVIAAFVSPHKVDRSQARERVGAERFVEVFCDAPLEVCEQRDRDGLYQRAREGELANVTGIDAPYETPTSPALTLPTGTDPVEQNVDRVMQLLRERGLLGQ